MNSESRWEQVLPALREFETFLSPNHSKLELQAAFNRGQSEADYRAKLKTRVFHQRGVYLIFDKDGSLQYVGKALFTFDKRIWTHDEHVDRWWTDLIPFADEHFFLAAALEVFLIVRLRPSCNKKYARYQITQRD